MTYGPCESAEAARALSGQTRATVAGAIGTTATRLKAEHDEFGGVLTMAEIKALRRHHRRHGIYMIDTPVVIGAVQFPPLDDLRMALARHERWPEPWPGDTWHERLTGLMWRWLLRLRGLGYRIGRPRPEALAFFKAVREAEANRVRREALRAK